MLEKRNQPVSNLSGGMKRKLQLAIALIGAPKVIYSLPNQREKKQIKQNSLQEKSFCPPEIFHNVGYVILYCERRYYDSTMASFRKYKKGN